MACEAARFLVRTGIRWGSSAPASRVLYSVVPQNKLFHVSRNSALRETELLHQLEGALREALPAAWTLTLLREADRSDAGRDAVARLAAPDGSTADLPVVAKQSVEPRDVFRLLQYGSSRRLAEGEPVVVASSYLSPRSRELLAEAGVSWFDATGNVRVQVSRPSVLIERSGADRNPFTDEGQRRLQSLRGAGAARVVRSLLDEEPPEGVRPLAHAAEVGPATVSRVLELLDREGHIVRHDGAYVDKIYKRSLARRWTQDYGLTTTNHAVPALDPRGVDRLWRELGSYTSPYAVTASAASRIYLPQNQLPVAPLSLLTLYVPDSVVAMEELRLRPSERGANVLLVEPFDAVAWRRTTTYENVQYVAASQVVADLLTAPGRAPEEAEQLLDALATTDQQWGR